ncbi:pseudouridine synthase [Persephonella sp.]
MKKLRLDKFLADLGFGTRKEVRKLIKQKRVSVNGEIVNNPSFHIDPENDAVFLDGEPLTYRKNHYFMLNKPPGYVTAKEDRNYPAVMELLSDLPYLKKLFPVGRLDIDTEGLLIITDDGQLGHRIAHPKWEIEKEYIAVVKGDPSDLNTDRFEKEGLKLKDYQTKPFKLEILETGKEESKVKITVKEGKYHIVKRIMEELGHPVIHLKRTRIGPVALDESLSPGEYRELTEEEVKSLKESVNL